MNTGQRKIEKKIRKCFILAAKNLPLERFMEFIPLFQKWLIDFSDQPTHSKWYILDMERELEKFMKEQGLQ